MIRLPPHVHNLTDLEWLEAMGELGRRVLGFGNSGLRSSRAEAQRFGVRGVEQFRGLRAEGFAVQRCGTV